MASRTVNRQLRTLKVTTPAGTAQATPQTTTFNVGNVILERLEIMIPPGHSGLTGIHVDHQGMPLVPFGLPPAFLIASRETIGVDVGFEVGAALSVVTYNTDTFDHSHYLRAFVNVWLGGPSEAAPVLVPITAGGDL